MNDEYISINNDNESDIMNLCKAVDLHALMIQESYYEDIDDVESYIESMIYDYSTGAVQEADSKEVFIDPRVIKAAKVYKHNKASRVSRLPGESDDAYRARNLKNAVDYPKRPNTLFTLRNDYDDLTFNIKDTKRVLNELEDEDPIMADEIRDDFNKAIDDYKSNQAAIRKRFSSIKPGKNSPGKKYKLEGAEMNDEFIMFNDDESYQESYESDESVTLEDVEAYLESLSTDIDEAVMLRDDMIQEEYEYEDLTLEDVETYIESAIDKYNNIVDTVNGIVQEAAEANVNNRVADYKESYTLDNPFERVVELDMEEPLTAYEFFDESYEPDDSPIVPYSSEGIYLEEKEELTEVGTSLIEAGVGAVLVAGSLILDKFITEKKYGRFPKDMKRLYQLVKSKNFEASENKRALKKALKAVAKDLRWMLGGGVVSRWKITVDETEELEKFKKYVDDLYTRGFMLSKDKETSNNRRVPERIEAMIKQGDKVLKILSKSVYKNPADDVTTEYMV